MTSKLLAKFGVWITRKFGPPPPPQQWRTVTCFEGFPEKTVYGGPYHSHEFAVIAAKAAAAQLGKFVVPYRITVEPVPPEETEVIYE